MVNYEPKVSLFSNYTEGYRLFDITWFRKRLSTKYRDIDGKWISFKSLPTGFNFNPYSYATIYGVGDVPVLISPTICPGGLCLGGGGELRGKFKEKVIRTIEKEDYNIKIIEYPVTKSVYLLLNDNTLLNKEIIIEGNFILGDSAITTEKDPFFFPFDEYSFNFIYSSYFPSDVTLNMEDIEDLTSLSKEFSFSAKKGDEGGIKVLLKRANIFKNILGNIILIFIPLLIYFLKLNKWINFSIRILVYFGAILALYLTLPVPLNVSLLNILNIVVGSLYFLLIIFIEIKLHKIKKK